MKSWNPLSSLFWTWENLFGTGHSLKLNNKYIPNLLSWNIDNGLSKLKDDFKKQVNDSIPEILQDPITYELPANVVFTPYGHCYDLLSLTKHWDQQENNGVNTTCPLTNRPLNILLLLNDSRTDTLKQFFQALYSMRQKLLDDIDNMTLNEKYTIAANIYHYQIKLKNTAEISTHEFEHIKQIDILKEHLKINIHSRDHLDFWQKNSTAGIIRKMGLVTLETIKDDKGQGYTIPRPIANIMKLALKPYRTESELIKTLEECKYNLRNHHLFANFFYRLSMSNVENKLFSTKNIDAVDLRKMKNN